MVFLHFSAFVAVEFIFYCHLFFFTCVHISHEKHVLALLAVCPSMCHLGSNWIDIHEILYLRLL
jgi:hypothetical protein